MWILLYLLASPITLIFIASALIYLGFRLIASPKKDKGNVRSDGTIRAEAREVSRPADDSAVQDLDSNPKDN